MKYKYAANKENYAILASGNVLYRSPGQAAFPVRLASEVFQQCSAYLAAAQRKGPYTLYDPCCGAAYHLTTLAYLHWNDIDSIVASDSDEEVLAVARKNLSLLTGKGIERRLAEIGRMLQTYGKRSHEEALASALTLQGQLTVNMPQHEVRSLVFQADILQPLHTASLKQVNIVFADIPYGRSSSWHLSETSEKTAREPVQEMLDTLYDAIPAQAIFAIASHNRQKIKHEKFVRLRQIRAGKRRITLLKARE